MAIAGFMNRFENAVVEIGAHSDLRGSSEHLDKVTDIRASRVRDALIEKFGIQRNRLIAKGYGHLLPIISKEEIDATEDQGEKEKLYQVNLRIELKVISVNN